MDWDAAADAVIKIVRELGIPTGIGLAALVLGYQALKSWGQRGRTKPKE